MMNMNSDLQPSPMDVIDRAAGLQASDRLYAARRFRATAIEHTQASHDALLFDAVEGLSVSDRLKVAIDVCQASQATTLTRHYQALLADPVRAQDTLSPAAAAMQQWARTLTLDPRKGDQSSLQALKASGLSDAAVVALAQLVAFLSYQTRVVAGLRALAASPAPDAQAQAQAQAQDSKVSPTNGSANPGVIRINGFTNETLQWRSWLTPVHIDQASSEQLAVLDESHPQARTSDYYLTLVHQPRMLQHRSTAYNAIMYAPGGLPRAERELGALVVSVTNGCVYCTSVHAQRYTQLAKRTDTVEQVFQDPSTAGSTPRERAIARLAQAVTLRPHALGPQDLAPLQALGFSDEDLIDLLHATAIFGWANRLMHNLGEPVFSATF